MLGDVSKLFVFKSLLTTPINVLPLHHKQTFLPIIWIFTEGEGDGIESLLPFKIFSTLNKLNNVVWLFMKYWKVVWAIWYFLIIIFWRQEGFRMCIVDLGDCNDEFGKPSNCWPRNLLLLALVYKFKVVKLSKCID